MARQQLNQNILTIGLIAGVGYLLYKYSDKIFGSTANLVSTVADTSSNAITKGSGIISSFIDSGGKLGSALGNYLNSENEKITQNRQEENIIKQLYSENPNLFQTEVDYLKSVGGYTTETNLTQKILDTIKNSSSSSLSSSGSSSNKSKATSATYQPSTGVLTTNTGVSYSVAPSKVEALKSQVVTSNSKTSTGGSSTVTSSPNYLSKITSSTATKKYI